MKMVSYHTVLSGHRTSRNASHKVLVQEIPGVSNSPVQEPMRTLRKEENTGHRWGLSCPKPHLTDRLSLSFNEFFVIVVVAEMTL